MKILILILLNIILISCSATPPKNIGIQENQQLRPCPDKPNCVNSMSDNKTHMIEAFPFRKGIENSKDLIKKSISTIENAKLIREEDNYLYYEFTTPIMRFVDDVEFYFNMESNKIEFRSASRIGHSDLGLNRKRMENIRVRYMQQ